MKLIACSVFDAASLLYGRPFYVAATAQAVRSFTDEVNRGEGDLSKHPADFELYQLGVFDDNSGDFVAVRERLCRGVDVVIPKE